MLKNWNIGLVLIALLATLPVATLSRGEAIVIPPLASDVEVARSLAVFEEWTAAYQRKDFETQYALVHPRIQKWKTRRMWKKAMTRSFSKNGVLKAWEPVLVSPIAAEKVPCTEMGQSFLTQQQTSMLWMSQSTMKLPLSQVKQL